MTDPYGQPTHWLTFDCQHCYKRTYIAIEDSFDTEDRFCPNCGISSEIINDYEDINNNDWYDEEDDYDYDDYG